MRISGYERFDLTKTYLSNIQRQMSEQQFQLSSGKNYQKVSDAPVRVNRSMLISNTQNNIEQYQGNLSDSKSFLEVSENVLGTTIDIMMTAKEQGMKAKNGTYSASDKKVFGDLVDRSIDQVVEQANTTHLNRYVFSGEQTNTPAYTFDGTTATYNGDGNAISMKVSSQMDMQVSEIGNTTFQGTLDSLINLRDQIRTGTSTDIGNALSQLETDMNSVIDKRSDIGVRLKTLDMINESYEQTKVDLKEKRQKTDDADFAKVASDYAKTQRLYQATIQSSLKMMENTILNYM